MDFEVEILNSCKLLGRAMRIRSTSLNWGGSFSENQWRISIPEDIDALLETDDLQAYVRFIASEDYDPRCPIAGNERLSYMVHRPHRSASAIASTPSPAVPADSGVQEASVVSGPSVLRNGWECLLHPFVIDALAQNRAGHWRDAVLNAVMAVFERLRERTSLELDGDSLATRAFSLQQPILAVGDLATETGRNDQVGFMTMLQGVYKGVRTPKAHRLKHDLDAHKAAQYLVMASLLVRRIDEAKRLTGDGELHSP
jgi:uncharacterized protein (TIGR02391 family)